MGLGLTPVPVCLPSRGCPRFAQHSRVRSSRDSERTMTRQRSRDGFEYALQVKDFSSRPGWHERYTCSLYQAPKPKCRDEAFEQMSTAFEAGANNLSARSRITGDDRRDGDERGRGSSLLQLAMSAERGRRGRSGRRGVSSLEFSPSDLHC